MDFHLYFKCPQGGVGVCTVLTVISESVLSSGKTKRLRTKEIEIVHWVHCQNAFFLRVFLVFKPMFSSLFSLLGGWFTSSSLTYKALVLLYPQQFADVLYAAWRESVVVALVTFRSVWEHQEVPLASSRGWSLTLTLLIMLQQKRWHGYWTTTTHAPTYWKPNSIESRPSTKAPV